MKHTRLRSTRLLLGTAITGLALTILTFLFLEYRTVIINYMYFCIDEVRRRSTFYILLLFAPALLFDTTRYYLSNFIYLCLKWFKVVERDSEPLKKFPRVSLIIPVYREDHCLKEVIDRIYRSDYPNFEIIVLDEGVSETIANICRSYRSRKDFIYVKKIARGGKPSSLNYGRQLASGEILMHLDGDTHLEPEAITEVVKQFRDPRVGAVAGNLKIWNEKESLCTRLQGLEFAMNIHLQRRWLALTDMLQIASGAFGCFRKEVLELLNGTDQDEGEDSDISMKVRKHGYRIAFASKAIGYTEGPPTWLSLYHQRVRWDRCYIRLNLKKHANLFDFRHFRIGDFLAALFDVTFNVGLLLLFPFYLLYLYLYAPSLILFVIVVTTMFYTCINFAQVGMVLALSDKKQRRYSQLILAPIFLGYSSYLRIVRTIAYVKELFSKKVVKNSYFPEKVWKNIAQF